MPSSSLVPEDPTVLLTIAGMLQFKPVFLGQAERKTPRATTTQKCIRTNDIENVGVTKRHHTFFEMLGNFSFGDYFKREAIEWAWELSTVEFGLPPERVWVSVFRDDDEAYAIWRDVVGVPEAQIQRLGEEDNFWAAGPTGPCGPCSELYYDFHPERGTEGASLEDDDRFIEFYNLVFMESVRDADGAMKPLANKNIDTGMGLERMAQILQGKDNNYETDLIFPIIERAASLAGVDYTSADERTRTLLKVIGDHVRAVAYLVSDGVRPSNVGRGYVVRRLLRRVVRNGRLLGIRGGSPFSPQVAEVAIRMSGDCDPAVQKNEARILAELAAEEARFVTTLDRGEELLEEALSRAQESDNRMLAGADAFVLYDTFGFPLEITSEVAAERGIAVDIEGFDAAMAEQRRMAQAAAKKVDVTLGNVYGELADVLGGDGTDFIGYDELRSEGEVKALVVDGAPVDTAKEGNDVTVILDRTPFYAESGGQVADIGTLVTVGGSCVLEVRDVQKVAAGRLFAHTAHVVSGELAVGEAVELTVDAELRRRIRCNHTATHLLQSALKEVLGEEVGQAGSLVTADRLRFDFNAPRTPTEDDISRVESLVNRWVGEGTELAVAEMGIKEAKSKGATMMFGEKYGDVVRVVDVPGVSMELCGGTHVANTAEIAGFRIVSEGGISAGVRRIEAVAGPGVLELLVERDTVVKALASSLKVKPEEVVGRVESVSAELREAQKHVASLKAELAVAKCAALVSEAEELPSGARVLVHRLDDVDGDGLKAAAETLLESLGDPAAVVLGGAQGDSKVGIVAALSPGAIEAGAKAGDVASAMAKLCGGGGGGRPNFAQAGGRDPSKLPEALAAARDTLAAAL